MEEEKTTATAENLENQAQPVNKKKKRLIVWSSIIAVILLVLLFLPGLIVTYVVPPIASQLLKVKVEFGSCFINIFDGSVRVRNLKVHNPQGYDSPNAFELGHFFVDVKMLSLTSPKIEIADIIIEDMHATLEMKLNTNNLQDISNNLPKAEKKAEEKPVEEENKKESPKMVIRHFKLAKSDFTMLKVPWPIPSVELNDVGDGKPVTEIVPVIYNTILDIVLQASKTVADGVVTVGKGITKGAADTGEAVIKGTGKVLDDAGKSIKKIFKK